VFGNKALRRLYGTRRWNETGDWRRLHNGEVRVIASRRMWQVRYMAKEKCVREFCKKN
jgi:hypothetical protein